MSSLLFNRLRSCAKASLLKLDATRFQWMKDRHKGKRGFVVGNGPSLRISDLDLLKGEITIASNKIYLAFDQTEWRPTYFTVVDQLVWPKIQPDLPGRIPRVFTASYLPRNISSISCRQWRYLGNVTECGAGQVPFSTDFGKGAWGGHTVTYENLQLAAFLGLDPIYIIGCDHSYKGEKNIEKDTPIREANGDNHFIKGYRAVGETVNPAPIAIMNQAFEVARDFSDLAGFRIFNATRGGQLETFRRVHFDSLF